MKQTDGQSVAIGLGVKFTAFCVLIISVVLAVFASLQFLNMRRTELNRVKATTQNIQLRLEHNLAAPMWNYAVDQAAVVLETEMRDSDLLAVHVVNAANKVIFVSKMRSGDAVVDAKGDEAFPPDARKLEGNIVWEGQDLGSFTLHYGNEELNRKLGSVIAESVLQFIAIDVILIISIILLLNLFILNPLSTVNVMVGTVAEGNLANSGEVIGKKRSIVDRTDEFGITGREIARMVVSLRGIVFSISEGSESLLTRAEAVSDTSRMLSEGAAEQAARRRRGQRFPRHRGDDFAAGYRRRGLRLDPQFARLSRPPHAEGRRSRSGSNSRRGSGSRGNGDGSSDR